MYGNVCMSAVRAVIVWLRAVALRALWGLLLSRPARRCPMDTAAWLGVEVLNELGKPIRLSAYVRDKCQLGSD